MNLKTIFFIGVAIILIAFPGAAFANNATYLCSQLTIGDTYSFVNEDGVVLDVAPYEKNGRTLVPLRFMEKALNAAVEWEPINQMVKVTLNNKEVRVYIGQKNAQVIQNGETKEVQLDVPAELKNGRTFVPIRFIGENLGASIQYEAKYKQIAIIYTDKAGWKEFKDSNGLRILYPPDWKVVSSSASGIKLETQNSTVMELKTQSKDVATLVKEKSKVFDDQYWELYIKESLPSINGTRIYGANDLYGYLYEIYIFQKGTKVYTWEKSGWNLMDEKMFRYVMSNV